ncbi:MAG: stealth conserved region 3 domain-containing protein [Atopobiaceae bacterium]|nr:stealth conserved region 3 domain-containing protein [Atopobiaceae bacterium]
MIKKSARPGSRRGFQEEPIDFAIAWVDGSDSEWRAVKQKYDSSQAHWANAGEQRYRDWGLLKYWFRAVEKHAPWVRRVHFITWGHIPDWLNTDYPKLHVVKHEDYIPVEYLPTFSSHTIELNLHRIPDLAQQFVYFNDDMFLNRSVSEQAFFANGLPRDVAALNTHCYALSSPIQLIAIRDVGVINDHFDFKASLKSNLGKWLRPSYGNLLLRTLPLLGCPRFPGFWQPHNAQPYLKKTFEEVWDAEPKILDATCRHRFREETDVNQWVMREWQIASGCFMPRPTSWSHVIHMSASAGPRASADAVAREVNTGRVRLLCFNDTNVSRQDYEYCRQVTLSAFKTRYPQLSKFEKEAVSESDG